jgi:hypothetical protein
MSSPKPVTTPAEHAHTTGCTGQDNNSASSLVDDLRRHTRGLCIVCVQASVSSCRNFVFAKSTEATRPVVSPHRVAVVCSSSIDAVLIGPKKLSDVHVRLLANATEHARARSLHLLYKYRSPGATPNDASRHCTTAESPRRCFWRTQRMRHDALRRRAPGATRLVSHLNHQIARRRTNTVPSGR